MSSKPYLNFFGLSRPPYEIVPDGAFFFLGRNHGQALASLRYIVRHEAGLSVIVGEIGTGKTLLARSVLAELPPDVVPVYLANPAFTPNEVLAAISHDLGAAPRPGATRFELLALLHGAILERYRAGSRVLLVVDEAHLMPPATLDEVRLLSNLETREEKLVNILLFGQPELDALLARHDMRQVRDRILHRIRLDPMPAVEAPVYLDHRLRVAGWKGPELFGKAAARAIWRAAGGRHRRINLIADRALLAAYAEGKRQVEAQHVARALDEMDGGARPAAFAPRQQAYRLGYFVAGVIVATALAVVATFVLRLGDEHPDVSSAAPAVARDEGAEASVSPPAEKEALSVPAVPARPQASNRAAANDRRGTPETRKAESPAAPVAGSQQAVSRRTERAGATGFPPAWRQMLERTRARLASTGNSEPQGYTLQVASVRLDALPQQVPPQWRSGEFRAAPFRAQDQLFVGIYSGDYSLRREAEAALAARSARNESASPLLVRSWSAIAADWAAVGFDRFERRMTDFGASAADETQGH